jgi:hypothetical protein
MPTRAPSRVSPNKPSARATRLVQLQPRPIDMGVGYLRRWGSITTIITRYWEVGAAERCRLCPRSGKPGMDKCCVLHDVCTVAIDQEIPVDDCMLFDTTNLSPAHN